MEFKKCVVKKENILMGGATALYLKKGDIWEYIIKFDSFLMFKDNSPLGFVFCKEKFEEYFETKIIA